ncbi:MAG TPA: metal-dependent phosphohydrolase [Ruminococcaceae bacterium]|nr:metal-dependent phosphohydrolase [Oscillospiraceae bacterium]
MIYNVISYLIFIKSTRDVLSGSKRSDKIWARTALVLLSFFLLGYIYVAIFGKPDLMVALILFGGSVFVSIVNSLMSKLLQTAKERSIDVAEIIIGAVDARDPNLNGHSRHVQNVTMTLFRHLPQSMKSGINPVSLEYASLMHDVGKLGIPESILNKPAKLSDDEWKVMKMHPKIGVEILQPLRSFKEIMPWIEYHHERIDGKGYYGITGDKIPLAARIIAVADTYSAITMRRSYKDPKTHDEAIAIIRDVAGTQLDAELVNIFVNIPKEELIVCAPPKIEINEI